MRARWNTKSLKRDADADKTVYEELTKKINEASINSGFQGSSIRLADLARPGAEAGISQNQTERADCVCWVRHFWESRVFVSDSLDHTIRDPEQVRRELQTEVLGALPVVKAWRGHLPGSRFGGKDGGDSTSPS